MMIARQEVNQLIGLCGADEPIVPKRIGFCSNPVDLLVHRGQMIPVPCSRPIDDQDTLAVELPQIGKRRQFCCGPCVDRLLSVKPPIDLDDKVVEKKPHRGINGNGGQPKPKQPKYVEEFE